MVKNNELKELKSLLNVEDGQETENVSIIFDTKQYSIRIPKRFVDTLKLNPKVSKFRFTLEIPRDFNKKPTLVGRLVSDNE